MAMLRTHFPIYVHSPERVIGTGMSRFISAEHNKAKKKYCNGVTQRSTQHPNSQKSQEPVTKTSSVLRDIDTQMSD
ncbi:hypothetical protein CPB83DRAFT_578871 [Crepidotus variabilis]|uniref:Uncharacterized protein n=1 Tax=Crepidotus variabilis TaxID=179855 RepID=A0A9P6JLH6_9AGAR|nr:hypothetical protein CPB83DRAFT_578871 [Crepidotus variabilis]